MVSGKFPVREFRSRVCVADLRVQSRGHVGHADAPVQARRKRAAGHLANLRSHFAPNRDNAAAAADLSLSSETERAFAGAPVSFDSGKAFRGQ